MARRVQPLKSRGSATIKDVAAFTGVSTTTVWRAVNNHPEVNSETKTRILRTVKDLGYLPSIAAQSMVSRRTALIGVIVPMLGSTAYSAMVRSIEHEAFARGYNMIVCESELDLDRERQYAELLAARRVEGVVAIPFAARHPHEYGHFDDLERRDIPVVWMDQPLPQDRFQCFATGRVDSSRQLVRHLLDLGHRQIGFFHCGMPEWDCAARQLYRGYEQALHEAGLTHNPNALCQVGGIHMEEEVALLDHVAEALSQRDRPTAIFANTDMLALKIMYVAYHLGIRVPEDLAVVGYDDILAARYSTPALTTVRQPTEEMGRRAAQWLFERIAHGNGNQLAPHIEEIPGELMIRESCGARPRHWRQDEPEIFEATKG